MYHLGSCFHSLYSSWIEAAGGRVVPIRYDAPPSEIEKLFNSLNGILFTGGETNIRDLNSTYMRTASQLLKATLAAYAKGNRIPLWYYCDIYYFTHCT